MSITYTIDGVKVVAEPSDTILTSATREGVEIPSLCFDKRTAIYGACGLCYRICDQEVGKTFLGLYNRGFSTVVNPMVPDEARTFCASCLKCVEACPTGAMKSVPAVERVTQIL